MKIILIGFMGSGKSSVAKRLGQILNWPILEMDALACQKAEAKNMHEIFAKGGEPLLRKIEVEIAQEYALADHTIISTGGGVVLNKSILDHLKTNDGAIVFLKAAFQTIDARLTHDTERPLFKNHIEAESLYHFRQPLYMKYADHIIEVDQKSVEEIAQEVLNWLQTKLLVVI